jgi:sporulation protein YlmC with PRC-barrel domain
MMQTADFTIGTEVACRDGACGKLARVVVDPVAQTLTRLVVEPNHRQGMGHLVPVDLVMLTSAGIQLRCSLAEFEVLEDAQETQFLRGATGDWGYPQHQMLSWPYYGAGLGGGVSGSVGMGVGFGESPHSSTYDRVPAGDVEVSRGDRAHATDGEIGKVQGLVIDPTDHKVTHVLLDEGHLWGRK